MPYKLLGALILLLSILVQDCDVSLFDLVISYEVNVQNAGTQPAFVHVSLSDLSRGASLGPGHSVSVTSFAGGKYKVLVTPFDPAENKALVKQVADLDAKLADPSALSPAEVTALTEQLRVLGNQLTLRNIGFGAVSCSGEIKVEKTDAKRSKAVFAVATNKGIQWSLSDC
jgi:hypothetical protein